MKNFHQFDQTFYRSSRILSDKQLEKLAQEGFTKVINLQKNFTQEKFYNGRESQIKEKYGIEIIHFPMHWYFAPSHKQLMEVFDYLKNHQGEKLLVHCKHGKDRTGMVVAYYKVRLGLSPIEDAIKEMLSFGFHKKWFFWWIPRLEKYLKEIFQKPIL